MYTLDELTCASVGGGAQDPKVTAAGGGLILGAVEIGKAVGTGVSAASSAGCAVLVLGAPLAAGGGFIVGTYIEEQTGIGTTIGDWVGTGLGKLGICW